MTLTPRGRLPSDCDTPPPATLEHGSWGPEGAHLRRSRCRRSGTQAHGDEGSSLGKLRLGESTTTEGLGGGGTFTVIPE